eukprot:5295622-Amphidinium_carterae.6
MKLSCEPTGILTHNVWRWKLPHRCLGAAWCSATGIAQGCPLSANLCIPSESQVGRSQCYCSLALHAAAVLPLACPLSGRLQQDSQSCGGDARKWHHSVSCCRAGDLTCYPSATACSTPLICTLARTSSSLPSACYSVTLTPADVVVQWNGGSVHSPRGSIQHLCDVLKVERTSPGCIVNCASDAICLELEGDDVESITSLLAFDGSSLHGRCQGIKDSGSQGPACCWHCEKICWRQSDDQRPVLQHAQCIAHRGLRFHCSGCQTPETTYHLLWECPCLSAQRRIQVTELPARIRVAAADHLAPGEMTDCQLTSLHLQRAQVAPASTALAACQIRLAKKTPPPVGEWLPDKFSASTKSRLDESGHCMVLGWFTKIKKTFKEGKEAVKCLTCRHEMLARAMSKLTRTACPGKSIPLT